MLPSRTTALAALLFFAFAPGASAAVHRHRVRRPHGMGNNLRRRLHVNSLITDPGTFEWEWGSLTDPGDSWYLPTTWKATFGTGDDFWGRTEWSLNFDGLQRFANDGQSVTHASDHLAFAITTALPDWAHMQWAFAPSVNFLLRGDSGARLGAFLLSKAEHGRHSGGFQFGWTGATSPSDSNPAGTAALGAGYGFRLGEGRWTRRTTLYANILGERSTGMPWLSTSVVGVELQITPQFAIDCSAQLQGNPSSPPHFLTACGLTWNLGRIRR